MEMMYLVAQQTAESSWWGDAIEWSAGSTSALGYEVSLRPAVGLPIVLVLLWLAALLLRSLLGTWGGRLAKKTESKIDDVIAEALKRAVFPLLLLVAAESLVSSTRLGESPIARQILVVAAILIVSWVAVRFVLVIVDAWIGGRAELTPLGPPIKLGIKILWVPLVLLTVLSALHVEIIQFVTTLGVGSLAIALALQDTLANVFSGIQLVVDQPIRAGDFIEVDKDTRGVVHEIGLRSTKIRTLNNNMIIVPNNVLAQTVIVNNEAYDRRYAHRFSVGVSYDSDSRHVQRVLEEVLNQAGREVDGILRGPHSVRFLEFGDSALVFRMEVQLAKFVGRRGPLSELNHRIHERCVAEGIDIPFPMRTVILHDGRDQSVGDPGAEPAPGSVSDVA
jgi:small-conductance mechanosensitive channel